MNPYHLIVVAGGKGTRMGSTLPKQFLEINGKPLIIHTIDRFRVFYPDIKISVSLASGLEPIWEQCVRRFPYLSGVKICQGGPERFHSVKSALRHVSSGEIVAIHDAVRPFVGDEVLKSGFRLAETFGIAIPAIELKESVRLVEGSLSSSFDRSRLRVIQTPQFFKAEIILEAYRLPYKDTFTDDASVAEAAGFQIRLMDGNDENIKITTPADIKMAQALLSSFNLS